MRNGGPAPDLAQVAVLRRAIRRLEDDARRSRARDDAEIHAEGVLAPVAREVDAARRLVRENAPGRRGTLRPRVACDMTSHWNGGVSTEPSLSLPAPTGPPPPGSRTVITDDGVPLHVEVDGDATPAHRRLLPRVHRPARRVGAAAGRAARPGAAGALRPARPRPLGLDPAARATIDRTGRDLGQVLDADHPDRARRAGRPLDGRDEHHGAGPAAARAVRRPRRRRLPARHLRRRPGRDRHRSAWRSRSSAGCACCRCYLRFLQLVAPLLERFRRRGTALGRRITRRLLFGADDADLANVRLVQDLLEETPYPVAMAFYATFLDHDETASLEVLRRVPVTVVAATHDRLTPAAHGRRIAEQIGRERRAGRRPRGRAQRQPDPHGRGRPRPARPARPGRRIARGTPVDSPRARARAIVIDTNRPRLRDPQARITSAATRRRGTAPVRATRAGRRGAERGPDERPRCEFLLRGEREHPDARRVGGRVRRAPAVLRRRRPAAAEQAAAGPAVPAARAAGADAAGPAAVGRRRALPDPVPRAAHRRAGSGQRRAAAQPGRPRPRSAPRHGQAAVGALAGRGPGRQPLGDHLQGPPLHGRRHRRHRPHAADVRSRARRHARRAQALDARSARRRACGWSPTR